jgi:hypothetical protein
MVTSNGQNQASELFGQVTRSFESAVQSGLKIQEESVKVMGEILSDLGSPQKWQKKAQAVLNEMISTSQRNMDEAVAVMNENAKTSIEMLHKAIQTQPTDSSEAQSRAMEMWETSLGILRKNTEAVVRANSRAVEVWTEMAKKVNGEQMERMAQMAQKATQAATAATAN